LADLNVIDRIFTAQQAAGAATDAAIATTDEAIAKLKPKIEATLDDGVQNKLSQDFATLADEAIAVRQKVDTARGDLAKRQREQTAAQQVVDAHEEYVKQQLDALNDLPGHEGDLAKLLKQQQTDLQTAFDAGNVRKAYVLLLELTATRNELDRLRQPGHEQALLKGYVTGSAELATKRDDLVTKRDAAVAQQDALTQAIAELKTFQEMRPKRLQGFWDYKD
jgi:hypothetical protein